MSDENTPKDETDETEVEGHASRLGANDEGDDEGDEVEGHMRSDAPRLDAPRLD